MSDKKLKELDVKLHNFVRHQLAFNDAAHNDLGALGTRFNVVNNRRYRKMWKLRNPIKVKLAKAKANSKNKFGWNISKRIAESLGGSKRSRPWESLVGYTLAELKVHLEARFTIGMNWDRYGVFGWHVDHIIPQSRFNFNDAEDIDFKLCWSLDNLQPLWAKDNIYKSDNIDKPFQPSLAIAKVGIYVK